MIHKCIRYGFLALALFASHSVHAVTPTANDLADKQSLPGIDTSIDSLVTAEWLKQHLDDSELVVLDASVVIAFDDKGAVSISSGRDQYDQGHIPTAGFADLTSDLVDTTSQYPYAIPKPEKFAAAMAALGVGDNSTVVLYATNYSAWAARVWWMLRWIGFDNAAILDGGLNAWTTAGFALSTDQVKADNATLSVALRPTLIVERDEVFGAISDNNVVLIDAMPAAHYRGEMVMYGRAGHIPTAINVPNVFSEDGRFLSDGVLAGLHSFDRKKRSITYCGGGISASSNAFVMHRLGFTNIGVYMNSLDEWAASPENPLVVQAQ